MVRPVRASTVPPPPQQFVKLLSGVFTQVDMGKVPGFVVQLLK